MFSLCKQLNSIQFQFLASRSSLTKLQKDSSRWMINRNYMRNERTFSSTYWVDYFLCWSICSSTMMPTKNVGEKGALLFHPSVVFAGFCGVYYWIRCLIHVDHHSVNHFTFLSFFFFRRSFCLVNSVTV